MTGQKVCPICGKAYPEEASICLSCQVSLLVQENSSRENEPEELLELESEERSPAKESNSWMYLSALLLPLAGVLLSAAKVTRGDKREGKY